MLEKIKISDTLFIGKDGKFYRGNIDDPDDCPRCKWRNGCPTGQVYYGLQTSRCNQGIFEPGEPPTPKPRFRVMVDECTDELLAEIRRRCGT